jgi:hypothetical protein
MQFPGLGRYAAMGSMIAARNNSLAAQNQPQMGPSYMAPTLPGGAPPVNIPGAAPELQAGDSPELPQGPGEITLPPMPVSSMIRDTAPRPTMASQMQTANRKYRGMA